eukprot:gene10701-1945_t
MGIGDLALRLLFVLPAPPLTIPVQHKKPVLVEAPALAPGNPHHVPESGQRGKRDPDGSADLLRTMTAAKHTTAAASAADSVDPRTATPATNIDQLRELLSGFGTVSDNAFASIMKSE